MTQQIFIVQQFALGELTKNGCAGASIIIYLYSVSQQKSPLSLDCPLRQKSEGEKIAAPSNKCKYNS